MPMKANKKRKSRALPSSSESPLSQLTREAEADGADEWVQPSPSLKDACPPLRAWRSPVDPGADLNMLQQQQPIKTANKELTDSNVNDIFPPVTLTKTPSAPSKHSAPSNRDEVHQLHQITATPHQRHKADDNNAATDTSNIGFFALLPGELRNVIFRLVCIPPSGITPIITSNDAICGTGVCTHLRLRGVAPGLTSTCRQLRAEALPIFLGENNVIRFDAAAVRNRCVANWVRCLGHYAELVREVALEIVVRTPDSRRMSVCEEIAVIGLGRPGKRDDGVHGMSIDRAITGRNIDRSGIMELVDSLDRDAVPGVVGWLDKLACIAASDELADLVYWCSK